MKLKNIARHWLLAFLYPRPLVGLFNLPRFFAHLRSYRASEGSKNISIADMQPCLGDWSSHTPFDAHYFYQGAWLSRRVATARPEGHVDIGSSVLTISVLSAWVDTVFLDYRPLKTALPRLETVAGNILSLPFADDSIGSLSCLHVIEHIGLGRYGDPIDPSGSIKAAKELQRVLKSGGRLYLSLPVGRERVCFNAHRVHSPETVERMFPALMLCEFSFVDDDRNLQEMRQTTSAVHLEYGCGLFVFVKP